MEERLILYDYRADAFRQIEECRQTCKLIESIIEALKQARGIELRLIEEWWYFASNALAFHLFVDGVNEGILFVEKETDWYIQLGWQRYTETRLSPCWMKETFGENVEKWIRQFQR